MMASRIVIVLAFILGISVPIQSQTTPDPNTMVGCRTNRSCEGSSVTSTIKDCCDHDIKPSGFAYTIPGIDGCNLCPVDFGFSPSSLNATEGEVHMFQVKFFSGGIIGNDGFFFNLTLEHGTTSSRDVELPENADEGRFLPGDVLESKVFSFTLRPNNIAQESKKFTIVLQLSSTVPLGAGANIRNRLKVVILDSNEITFQLSEVDYTQNEEPNALMEVLITKESGIQLANPVYFRITPLTVDDALARGVIKEFEDENMFSPNRANYKDFNDSVIYLEFPTDKISVEVTIPIVDDDIDEADEQVFIILLEAVDATNLDKLNILENRHISIGRIIDDEIIRIGFERPSYEVTEPNPEVDNEFISNLVYLIRENNQTTEQTYSLVLTVSEAGGNAATLQTIDNKNDYSLGVPGQTQQRLLFEPLMDRISFNFRLNSDLSVEGTETFRVTSSQDTSNNNITYPVFQTPIGANAFTSTLIHILDELMVGFEELNYTVNESDGIVEVCAAITSPPEDADLNVTVILSASTIDGTAEAGSDFTKLTAFLSTILVFPSSPGSPTAGPRRECFEVTITDDDTPENTESFSLFLQEDTFNSPPTGAIISPDRTEIFILDEDEVVIGFFSESYSVSESAGTASIEFGVITGSLGTTISVNLSFSDGSALSGSDYTSTERVYSLTGRETVTVDIGIIEDDKFEHTEVFYASLSFDEVPLRVALRPDRTKINIIGAEALTFSFRAGTYSFMENMRTGTVYVDKISGSTDLNITLMVSGFLPGGQTSNQLITFSPLDSEKAITFNIPDNSIALEPPETFTLTLTAVTSGDGIMLQPNNKTDITILDDDELIIGFAGDISVSESENATLSITFSSAFATNFNINIGPSFNDSLSLLEIADPDEDYFLPNFTVEAISTLHNASNSLYFDVSIIQDEFLEYEECFVTAISLPNSVSDSLMVEIAGGKDTALVCIENDDRVTISFDRDMYSVGENDGTLQILASLVQGELQRPVEVLFSTQSDTATSEDPKDFQSLQRVALQFDELLIQNDVSVNIINDNIFEDDEIFFASLVTNDAFVDFGNNNATITIVDHGDGVRFGFGPVQYTVNESAGLVTLFVVLLEGTLEREVNLQYSTVEGTATESDYQTVTRTITFSSSVSNVSVQVTIVDDSILESTENFLLNLADPQRQTGVSIMPSTANVTILDNDGVTIGFERTAYSVEEGDVVEVCAVLTGTLEKLVEVSVSSSSGSATVNEDYNPVAEALTFDQAKNRACFNVTTLEDQTLEETTENLNLDLSILDMDVTLFPDQAQVNIRDNDRVTFGLENTLLTLIEGGGATARVCVIVITGTLGRDVTVTLSTVDGTATSVDPADFVALLNNITFNPGDREICQDISILDDTLYEEDESFSALLSTGDSSADIDPSRQSATIIIMDTDVITIGFTRESDMVEEDVDTIIIICVEVKNNGTLEKSITVQLDTVDGTAKASEDYNSISHSLVFTPDNERDQQCRAVNILSDDNLEGTETFTATLSTGDDVSLVPDTETIVIIDNDVVNIVFIGGPFEGIEDSGFVAITVGVMEPDKLKTEVSVNLTTEDIVGISNAATAGVDYRPLAETLTFSESVTMITVNITLLDDNALEGDEDFRAQLSTNSGSNVGLGPDAIITIIDDDRVIIGFEEETVQVDENVGMKTLCVNVSRGQLARTTTVSIAYQDQTAINGQEYSAQPMTFTFSKDDTGQCFNVGILDDDIDEPEKTFLVMLLTGDPQVTLSPDTATITIIDNDERRVAVNDTIIGDPLFTVPILVDRDQREMLNMTKPQLCYEIHGDANQWFNLVTDNCTTVNALYTPLNDRLNVITKIGVKAVDDDNKCVEILVDRSQCSVSVNGTVLGMESYSSGNIKVRRYSKRARISVPNCNDINLIMWVICEERTILNSDVTGEMLKFVVLRGLNYGRRAHGLLGQFWNVPVDITPYTDLLHDGTPATDRFNIKVKRDKGNDARSFTGLLYELSWDHVEEPCLYVGNKQAGPIHEVATPNDGVIENIFQNYIVSDAFSEEYEFSLFDLVKCSKVGSD